MQTTYFCNVFREDDKVTKWIRTKFRLGSQLYPEFNMVVARLVNKTESLEKMGWPFSQWTDEERDAFTYTMCEKGAWGSAYIVSTNGKHMPKHEHVLEVLNKAYEQLLTMPSAPTLATAHTQLMGIYGLASFMAAQVVADLKNTPGHELHTAPDWWTWCAHGPGSLRGVAWVMGQERCTPTEFKKFMVALPDAVRRELKGSGIPRIGAQDLQNCLCEFDKYMRVSTGTGKSKRKYDGTGS